MDEVNQLILDCMAKVLRINQTTKAEISIGIEGYIHALNCSGFLCGYHKGSNKPDYNPLIDTPCNWIDLSRDNATDNLRALLSSLNDLEKELLNNA